MAFKLTNPKDSLEHTIKMPFGRYKGDEIGTLPDDYLEWCINNIEPTKDIYEYLEKEFINRKAKNRL